MNESLFDKPLIAYDGSTSCHELFKVFIKMHPKFELSTFTFVHDPLRTYVPESSKANSILKEIENKTEGLENIDIKIVEKVEGISKTTNEYIHEQFLKSKSSFMILGFYGSKGKKVRSVDLSSRIRTFVYDSKATIAIIKNSGRETNLAIFCLDGSEISFEGLKKALKFCTKFGYSLTVLHTYNDDTKSYSKQIKNELKSFQDKCKPEKFETIIEKTNLVSYLQEKETNYDWIIMTKNGYRGEVSNKSFVGSHSTDVLTSVNANLLII